jgi:hypothetical protein
MHQSRSSDPVTDRPQYSAYYEGGKNKLLNLAHQSYFPGAPDINRQAYDVGPHWYRATGASYSFTVNLADGIIIGLNRESPRWAAKERNPPVPNNELPLLKQFSDVAWISWKLNHEGSGVPLNHLKYFMSTSVTNVETVRVLKRALEANGWVLEKWPGHTFERIWPETKAILGKWMRTGKGLRWTNFGGPVGSPNVQGFAYFLIQHKMELGNMFIDKIQVFMGETDAELPCILAHVKQPLGQGAEVERNEERTGSVRVHTFRAKL